MKSIVSVIALLFFFLLWPARATAQNNKWSTVEPEPLQNELKSPEPIVVKPEPKPKLEIKDDFGISKTGGKKKKADDNAFLPSTCFYLQPTFQAGTLMGVGIAAGGYISNFNVEAFFTLGLAKSEEVFWRKSDGSDVTCTYKPMAFGFRVGYGFAVAEKIRLTPQAGLSVESIKSEEGNSRGYAASAIIGLRGDYALSKNIAIFAAPEVAFAASKSDVFKQLEDVSSKIKGWATGFNARLGVTITF